MPDAGQHLVRWSADPLAQLIAGCSPQPIRINHIYEIQISMIEERLVRFPFGVAAATPLCPDWQSIHGGGGNMQTFKLGKQMTPAELLLVYKTALEAIAKGSADPAKIAQEALKL